MNRLKKYASLLLALVMALALAVPAMAGENVEGGETTDSATVTIDGGTKENNLNGHTFTAYQIFSGTQSEDGRLGNVTWGADINGDSFLAALKADASPVKDKFAAATDAASAAVAMEGMSAAEAEEVAKIARNYVSNGATIKETGSLTLPTGYYLIVDTTENIGENEAYNSSLFQLTDDITIAVKKDVTTVEKKVKDKNDSNEEGESGWQDSADYDIGDEIPFQLTATLPNNVSNYDTYKLVFHDQLSAGLEYVADSAVVTIDGVVSTGFTVGYDATTHKLTVSSDDVKALGATNSSVIIVVYKAKLTDGAVTGSAGNDNKVKLEYSNNPDHSGTGDNETTETPDDTVVVFTFQTIVNKTDPEGNALEGAGFTLNKWNEETGAFEEVKVFAAEADKVSFEFKGLDDGRYQLVESTTPDGYNTIDPIYFVIVAEHDVDSANPQLTKLVAYLTDENGNIIKGLDGNDEIWAEGVVADGSMTAKIENRRGALLPETGGIGTTIFYALGGLLTVGAVVLLVTKKRMSADEK